MTLMALLIALRAKRVALIVNGERLTVDAPEGALSDALKAAMKEHRQALLMLPSSLH